MIPLILRLKKASHREIAKAQDIIVEEMANRLDKAALHGGTAIWRCYGGNRFSEDINAYVQKEPEKISAFFASLERKGFAIEKKKVSANSIYSNLKFGREYVRFEAVFKKAEGILKEYETAESNFITVYSLSPEALISEKVDAYLKRLKIRDIYDIFFLLRHITDISLVRLKLKKLLEEYKAPIDEKELKVLILEGIVPDCGKMLEYIRHKVQYG